MRPSSLKPGDTIAVVATSRVITKDQMHKAYEVFESWGLKVLSGNNLFSRDGYFAGTDDQRQADLQAALDDTNIKAIFCARGGYGMTRIVDRLDWRKFTNNPKWVIGFSDVTALHLAISKLEIESIHGLMPVQYDYMGVEQSLTSLHSLLFEDVFEYVIAPHESNINGEAKGELIGGNLSLLAESLGTRSEIDTEGRILFVEEIDEYLYKIDRMFNQLSRAGKLDKIVGLLIGDFSELKDTAIPFGKSFEQLVLNYFKDRKSVPIAFNVPVGHEAYNLAMPVGRNVQLTVADDVIIKG